MNVKEIAKEPNIDVGVMTAGEIAFGLQRAAYLEVYRKSKKHRLICEDKIMLPEGEYHARLEQGKLALYLGDNYLINKGERYRFVSLDAQQEVFFRLHAVRIGIDFHWDRTQEQCFVGELHLQIDQSSIIAINRLPLEDYLLSVISSEMSAKAGVELLRAHAIISRSWLLAQGLGKHLIPASGDESIPAPGDESTPLSGNTMLSENDEHIKWYERDAHTLFDVCADDHCQRYQGFALATTPQVKKALASTRGMVIACEEEICDARFYKCCGGKTEVFEACWSDHPKPYLQSISDCASSTKLSSAIAKQVPANTNQASVSDFENLCDEAQARAFICSSPEAFCHTHDKEVLQQVLNDYDQETADFYRWEVRYGAEELSDIVKQRSGIDFGRIKALLPVQRSHSARLVKLKIVGKKRSMVVGKELEIRRFLSRTHLYSSAFVVDEERNEQGEVETFVLKGAGWGHGVGLCQIGAAMMSQQGYSYKDILAHYYPNTEIITLY